MVPLSQTNLYVNPVPLVPLVPEDPSVPFEPELPLVPEVPLVDPKTGFPFT